MKLKQTLLSGRSLLSILAGWLVATTVSSCRGDDPDQKGNHTVAPENPPSLAVDGKRTNHPLTNSVEMKLFWCPKGEFLMGSPTGEVHRLADEAQAVVEFSRGFWMSRTEVTQAQWEAVMGEGSNPSSFKTSTRHPVENVTWKEAMEFCRKLTQSERATGLLPKGWEYTLPTEAQWEYACRAGTTGPYAGDLEFMAWHKGNSFKTTHPVGELSSNPWGFQDMHGNVWEWCRDFYASRPHEGGLDPTGPNDGTKHVTRGGGWDADSRFCRSAFRAFPGRLGPKSPRGVLGFRVVLELSPD